MSKFLSLWRLWAKMITNRLRAIDIFPMRMFELLLSLEHSPFQGIVSVFRLFSRDGLPTLSEEEGVSLDFPLNHGRC